MVQEITQRKMLTEGEEDIAGMEYYATTNLLSLRVKWLENSDMLNDLKKCELLSKLNEIIEVNTGVTLDSEEIEKYQYLSDSKRMAELEDYKSVYLFERGNKELTKWYKEEEFEDSSVDWFYDIVIQARFKYHVDLEKGRDEIIKKLGNTTGLQCWSLSENKSALNHPGNLYVRGIPKDLTKNDLLPVFEKFGPVLELKVITDSVTNESLGFGFVSYSLGSQASTCIKELNGNLMNGSPLFVNYHVERKERERIHLDQWRQLEEGEDIKFNGVFVGNIPAYIEKNTLVTPELIIKKIRKDLPECEILSYYFPRTGPKSNGELTEDSSSLSPSSTSITKCCNTTLRSEKNCCKNDTFNNEEKDIEDDDSVIEPRSFEDNLSNNAVEPPLKGYGFIRFKSHEMALQCIEKLNDCLFFGSKLIVKKAAQKHHHPYNNHKNYIINGNNMRNGSISSVSSSSSSSNNINNKNNNNIGHISNPNVYSGYNYPGVNSFYSYYPPVQMGVLPRRHSERSDSSRKPTLSNHSSSDIHNSIPQVSQIPSPTFSKNPSPRCVSRKNSSSQDKIYDPHSSIALPNNTMTTTILPIPVHSLPATSPVSILPQQIPALGNHQPVSHLSPRSKSMFATPTNQPPLPISNHLFNVPLPIPRNDEQESNLYVKHIPLDWRDEDLYNFFRKYGEIISAKIITVGGSVKDQENSETKKDALFGKSKGYGFVCFQNPLDASKAMYHTDGFKLEENHILFVSFAHRKSKSVDFNKGTPLTFNYNKKFMNAIYKEQQNPKSLQKQFFNPWMMPVPYIPRSE